MRRRPIYHHGEWQTFAALTVVALALLVSHQRAAPSKEGSRPERAARAVLVPLQESLTAIWRQVAYTVGGVTRAGRLARENEQLREANAELEAKLIQRQLLYLEQLEIVKAFGLEPKTSPTELRARVVGRSPGRFIRQTIDLVTIDGREARKRDIVLWAGCLVGRVESAQGSRAKATLLLDPDSGAAAVVKPSNAKGAVMGPDPASRDPDLLRLVHLERDAPIAVGEKVYTSPIGEIYPPGILIGEVQEVIGGAGPAEPKTALVRPHVDFGDLNYVTIMRPASP
ncbi:MAG: rod shape-determining protein MreC [Armatimonadetes bacterium]|nr:rod shape-determining protein MreC [Armatimonadota bacterium]